MRKIKVLVVDNDLLSAGRIFDGLQKTFDVEMDCAIPGKEIILSHVGQKHADIILFDINTVEVIFKELISDVAKISPQTKLATMVDFIEYTSAMDFLISGGYGILLKSQSSESITLGLCDIAKGGVVINPKVMRNIIQFFPQKNVLRGTTKLSQALKDSKLSIIDKEILKLLCDGRSNAEISNMTYYAESTVKSHISKIMNRFDVSTRVQLVVKMLTPLG